jgi:hypothetical protein
MYVNAERTSLHVLEGLASKSYRQSRLYFRSFNPSTYNATVDNNRQRDKVIKESKVKQERLLLTSFFWEM